jgi:hypothetical protein
MKREVGVYQTASNQSKGLYETPSASIVTPRVGQGRHLTGSPIGQARSVLMKHGPAKVLNGSTQLASRHVHHPLADVSRLYILVPG